MKIAPYGFRILGPCTENRRLVDAAAALAGYATCDERAEVDSEAYLSAFQFGDDFRRHLDYIHYNPVKHGLAQSPAEWPWSTFHRYVAKGVYEPEWGSTEPAGCDAIFSKAE